VSLHRQHPHSVCDGFDNRPQRAPPSLWRILRNQLPAATSLTESLTRQLLVHESLHARLTDAANTLTSNVTRSRMMVYKHRTFPGDSLLTSGLAPLVRAHQGRRNPRGAHSHSSELRRRTVHKRRALAIPIIGARNNFPFGLANGFLSFPVAAGVRWRYGLEDKATRGGNRTANGPSPRELEGRCGQLGYGGDVLAFCARLFPLCFGTIGRQYTRVSCV
jgi:hypothetical protein